jgi:glycosyltransferase involved in cell wall biosynthesis
MPQPAYYVCMIHPFDPRGDKVGGIETYIRDYIAYHPEDMKLLLVGVDGFGDLETGAITQVTFRGRTIDFLPIMRYEDNRTNEYASRLRDSLTLRFFLNLISQWRRLRRLTASKGYTVELRRVEFAPFAASLRRPFIQMLHDGAEKKADSMSSLLKKYWFAKETGDYLALALCNRFYCVNENLTERLRKKSRRFSSKVGTLTTWANTEIFRPTPFDLPASKLRLVYAGRLDLFKNPSAMFSVVRRVRELTQDGVEFHYIGDGDPTAFPEFDAIDGVTVLHGRVNAPEVAAIMSKMHVGVLTSEFEGMPRFVMESLAAGRPVCALHLPQLEQVISDRSTGALIRRSPTELDDLAHQILETWKLIQSGDISPADVASAVAPFTPERLLSRIFADHRRLQGLPFTSAG